MLCEICGTGKSEYTCPFMDEDGRYIVYKVCSACVPDEMLDYVMDIKEGK